MDKNLPEKHDQKLAFETQKEAVTAATVARFQRGGVRLKAYKCNDCGLWHLATAYTPQ